MVAQYSGNYSSNKFITDMMLDLAQNSPPKVKIPTLSFIIVEEKKDPSHTRTHPYCMLQVPTTQLAKLSIDPKFVELTADFLELFLLKSSARGLKRSNILGIFAQIPKGPCISGQSSVVDGQ